MNHVEVTNYQSIAKADLTFAPGVNILIGPSDSGKSALIRAIRDCCFNNTGTGFIRAGQKKTTVAIDNVQWEKSKSVNRYTMVDGEVLDKVGRTAPDQVGHALGIREVEFGDGIKRRLQFAFQLDPHFMLAENPADNAKVLGKLADLHTVYNAIREGEKLLKAANRDAEKTAELLAEEQARLETAQAEYDEAAAEVAELEAARDRVAPIAERLEAAQRLEAHHERLTGMLSEDRAEVRATPGDGFYVAATRLQDALRLRRRHQVAGDELEHVKARFRPMPGESFFEAAADLARARKAAQVRSAALQEIEALRANVKPVPDVDKLRGSIERLRAVRVAVKARRAAGGDVSRIKREIKDRADKLAKVEKALAAVDVCPTCGQPAELKV